MKKFRRQKPEQADNDAEKIKNSVFRSFKETEFLPYQSWKQLEKILKSSNGGAYGISGPRGSGKTWLISKSVEWARQFEGVGLWFPTPSDYGAEPFLSSLADNFASEVQRKYSQEPPQWYTRLSSVWTFAASAVLLIIFIFFFRSYIGNFGIYPWWNQLNIGTAFSDIFNNLSDPEGISAGLVFDTVIRILLIIVVYGSGIVFLASSIGMVSKTRKPIFLYLKARTLKQRLRYSETLRRSLESGVTVGQEANVGVSLQAERNLAERALTIASLVYEFRDFMQQVSKRTEGPIVIGIDELDKIHDASKAKELLRDIKGIFEVDGVHFLVSVSDEARKTLQLGAMQERDEFSSSFYTVIDILPHTPRECADLLSNRSPNSFAEDALTAIGILSGGNLRETLRLAASCLETNLSDDTPITLAQALSAVLGKEARIIRNEVIGTELPEAIKVEAYKGLDPDRFASVQLLDKNNLLPDFPELILEQKSEQSDISPADLNTLVEIWSKFQVRFTIVKYLLQNPEVLTNEEMTVELQEVVITVEDSAAVAKHCFESLILSVEGN